MERSAAQGSGMVHAQAADAVAGSGCCPDPAVVDSGRGTSRAVSLDDREVPGTAGVAGVGCRTRCVGAAVRGRRIAGLPARARESAEPGQHGLAARSADDDDVRLCGYFVTALLAPKYAWPIYAACRASVNSRRRGC